MDAAEAQAKLASVARELGREVHVFVNPAARNSDDPKPLSDEPDDFYEFTTEDYIRLLASKKEESILKTKKLRDAEQAACRAKITKAVIKVQFPDDYLIQTTFQPSETISMLMDLLKKVIAQPNVPFYIYTTPPKKRITDLTKDFYSANLVPGALVRFHYDVPEEEEKGPFLRDDIMALCDLHSILETKEAEKPAEPEPIAVEPPPEPSNNKPVGKKNVKPKWLRR